MAVRPGREAELWLQKGDGGEHRWQGTMGGLERPMAPPVLMLQ